MGLEKPEAEKLLSNFSGVSVLGLGEATHGTSEIFRLKTELIKQMIASGSLKVVGFEASYGNCLAIDEYIQTGKGDPQKALSDIGNWPWRTTEVLALLEFLRQYNQTKKKEADKVHFVGFDVQQIAGACAYLLRFHPSWGRELQFADDLKYLSAFAKTDAYFQTWNDTVIQTCQRVEKYLSLISKKNPGYDRLEKTFRFARLTFSQKEILNQVLTRDSLMAEMVLQLAPQKPGEKMVLWAHNGHVMRYRQEVAPGVLYLSLGQRLHNKIGPKYAAIGFDFNQGSFRAVDAQKGSLSIFTVNQAPDGSFSQLLGKLGHAHVFISLRDAQNQTYFKNRKLIFRQIEAVFDPENESVSFGNEVLPELFDGWWFVNQTTATTDSR